MLVEQGVHHDLVEGKGHTNVITDIVDICNFPAYVFFDPGVTYSFVFMSKLGKKLEHLEEELFIYNPVSNTMIVSEALRGCELLVESVSLLVDLLPLELQELDVMLL